MTEFDETEFLGRLLSYNVEKYEPQEVVTSYHSIEIAGGYKFSLVKSPATHSWNFYREGQSICDEPTHTISADILCRIRGGEEFFLFVCNTCVMEQKIKRYVKIFYLRLWTRQIEDTPYLGKSIVFRTKMPNRMIKREVYCTRIGCTGNLVEYVEGVS